MTDFDDKDDSKNLLEENGLKIDFVTDIKVGETYPIYGVITDIISENPFIVKVNYNIELELLLEETDRQSKIDTIKDRVFEPGIFLSTIDEVIDTEEEYKLKGFTKTVIFGKKESTEFDA